MMLLLLTKLKVVTLTTLEILIEEMKVFFNGGKTGNLMVYVAHLQVQFVNFVMKNMSTPSLHQQICKNELEKCLLFKIFEQK
eukprot:TRINITY_DN3299_c3_g6_i1.p1 TRINITY_DN3299_c3_g6~~TRINITY_DN3299_c3_g6_i1.p1  ORF type:complete len:82 (+),score=14.28 TRINITY_DN3299_c3_g6_i1:76-321(+)